MDLLVRAELPKGRLRGPPIIPKTWVSADHGILVGRQPTVQQPFYLVSDSLLGSK